MLAAIADRIRSKSYELPLSRDYVRHWGLKEAIRELVQNALDSESPFEYAFADGQLFITSRFARLEASTLVLGSTSKADRSDAIGSFGEGYKIALLVLTRHGYDVKVWNGNKQWVPEFRHSDQFDAEVLCINETPAHRQNQGVEFVVSGLTEDDEAEIRSMCLRMQPSMSDVIGTKYGHILPSRPGKLYVGTLFVCDTDLTYGYDILPEYLQLERDRQTVSGWDLKQVSKNAWIDTGRLDEVAEKIEAGIPDVEYVEYGSTELVKEACYRLFQKKHPGAIAVQSQEELNNLVKQGMTNTVVVRGAYYSQIANSTSYKQQVAHVVAIQTPKAALEEWYRDNKKYMSRLPAASFKELVKRASGWRNK
ncbi:hypothetical protein [Pseudomonas sp. SR18]|uniref:hypothetical protein n=1 Tax=Pseudomonas sp. SR18 TaxID=1461074 RepID=UPI002034735C|nr:hypothetical protein [Pseudomonas sp. SR18]MCM2362431.1 hypothetical protein [Pseudomonas sp. SR18]